MVSFPVFYSEPLKEFMGLYCPCSVVREVACPLAQGAEPVHLSALLQAGTQYQAYWDSYDFPAFLPAGDLGFF